MKKNKLTPHIYEKNVYDINYLEIKKKGIKLLCFDLDNTLEEPDKITDQLDPKLNAFLEDKKLNFEILIVSNNTIKGRVSSFADKYNVKYIESMKKPFLKNYLKSEIITKYKKEEVLFIGDKIITDVLGAKRYGSFSALVDPLFPKKKVWYNQIMYVIDKVFLKLSKLKKEEYYFKI